MKAPTGRNDLWLSTSQHIPPTSHFRLSEFENNDGLAMVHSSILTSLEKVRFDLFQEIGHTVHVIITSAVRTAAHNLFLASTLGWLHNGGLVSRDSMHLPKYGGIAVDLKAFIADSHHPIPQLQLGAACWSHFDWVKDDYADGHVHADNRIRCLF